MHVLYNLNINPIYRFPNIVEIYSSNICSVTSTAVVFAGKVDIYLSYTYFFVINL